jgi:hypothetical protein
MYDRRTDLACSDDYGSLSMEVLDLLDTLLEALCELVPVFAVCR